MKEFLKVMSRPPFLYSVVLFALYCVSIMFSEDEFVFKTALMWSLLPFGVIFIGELWTWGQIYAHREVAKQNGKSVRGVVKEIQDLLDQLKARQHEQGKSVDASDEFDKANKT